ncbi:formate dehydrogenase accessory protein FdhE [Pasteurellaceae bacterium LIM206]|nr:formate dehydrogenase accessory protein FdhE [Pasteurellaceae bacterium LIM206]
MSIRILPQEDIKQTAGSFYHPALLFSNPKNLYQRRAERLRKLSEKHPFADYLKFAADIADGQLRLLGEQPLPRDARLSPRHMTAEALANQPLNAQTWQRNAVWLSYLNDLLRHMETRANEQTLATIDWLEKASTSQLESLADKLLAQDYTAVDSDKAVFIWAALSLYWLQMTQQIPHHTKLESDENLHICPVCGSAPVASVVQFGSSQGLRYLHCSLCESEWNVVRANCTNCNESNKIDYWSIDEQMAAVRTESCGDCHSYLKILYQEKDPHVEPVADDLASIFLDIEMEERGFSRSGLNPFMFPAEEI